MWILIAEDESSMGDLLTQGLQEQNHTVTLARNGEQALAALATANFDAIVLDVMMPVMDGPETFRELQKNPATASIPVLLLTAKVQSSDQRRFADLGVKAILFKPFDPLTLADQISSALGWD